MELEENYGERGGWRRGRKKGIEQEENERKQMKDGGSD